MGISARILADSLHPSEEHINCGRPRLTTMEVVMPRMILAEFNTHRMFSRNSASSRAIPVEKQIKRVLEDPFIPLYWGKNQKGMSADVEISGWRASFARYTWVGASRVAVYFARILLWIGVHKQITNRLLEPFMWHTVIVTATDWDNFFNLRTDKNAQPEMQAVAKAMKLAYEQSTPKVLEYNHWHLPLVDPTEDLNSLNAKLVSVGRCARVSYLTHDGRRDPAEDVKLAERLCKNGHMSPFEHVAKPMRHSNLAYRFDYSGNFRGFHQYRKFIDEEAVWRPPATE